VWLPFVLFLFPLPPQAGKQLMNEVASGEMATFKGQDQSTGVPAGQQAGVEARIVSAFWTAWIESLSLVILGLCVGILAWRGHRYWKVSALGLSIVYLAVIAFGYISSERPVPDSLLFFGTDNSFLRSVQLNLRLVEAGISNGSLIRPARIVYANILMPVFQAIVLGWLLWFYVRKQSA